MERSYFPSPGGLMLVLAPLACASWLQCWCGDGGLSRGRFYLSITITKSKNSYRSIIYSKYVLLLPERA